MDNLEYFKKFQEELKNLPQDQIISVAQRRLTEIQDPELRRIVEDQILILIKISDVAAAECEHVVVLIHGIMSYAVWEDKVEKIIREKLGLSVYQLRYAWFDLFRFLCPFYTRKIPIERVLKELKDIRDRHETSRISVICHSFGTFIISEILKKNRNIKLHHAVFCGSVVKEEYDWANLECCPGGRIINDCGNRDYWPIIADRISFIYGPSGTFGFTSTRVKNRYHDTSHDDYFNDEFIKRYWVSVLHDGSIEEAPARIEPNLLLKILAHTPGKTIAVGFIALIMLYLASIKLSDNYFIIRVWMRILIGI